MWLFCYSTDSWKLVFLLQWLITTVRNEFRNVNINNAKICFGSAFTEYLSLNLCHRHWLIMDCNLVCFAKIKSEYGGGGETQFRMDEISKKKMTKCGALSMQRTHYKNRPTKTTRRKKASSESASWMQWCLCMLLHVQ